VSPVSRTHLGHADTPCGHTSGCIPSDLVGFHSNLPAAVELKPSALYPGGFCFFPLCVVVLACRSLAPSPYPCETKAVENFDIDQYPVVPTENRPRPLFFNTLSPDIRHSLVERGYGVMLLNELPRGTPTAERNYLLAKAQAIEEGTIDSGRGVLRVLELQMRAQGMLDKKSFNVQVKANLEGKELEDVLNWSSSRHTLAGNTTMQGLLSGSNSVAEIHEGMKAFPETKQGASKAVRQSPLLNTANRKPREKREKK
jgi:hypothetical protein